MTCQEIDTLPFPSCATTLLVGNIAGGTANPVHRARLRNAATGRLQEAETTVEPLTFAVTVNLSEPLQEGHEYLLEIWDHDTIPAERHEVTLCSTTASVVRLRPVLIYGPDGEPSAPTTVVLQCPEA
jgi:hypothetical protein